MPGRALTPDPALQPLPPHTAPALSQDELFQHREPRTYDQNLLLTACALKMLTGQVEVVFWSRVLWKCTAGLGIQLGQGLVFQNNLQPASPKTPASIISEIISPLEWGFCDLVKPRA